MAFVQIIEHRTSKPEEMQRLGEEWEAAAQADMSVTPQPTDHRADRPG